MDPPLYFTRLPCLCFILRFFGQDGSIESGIKEALRMKGVGPTNYVQAVVLESNGGISVIKKNGAKIMNALDENRVRSRGEKASNFPHPAER